MIDPWRIIEVRNPSQDIAFLPRELDVIEILQMANGLIPVPEIMEGVILLANVANLEN